MHKDLRNMCKFDQYLRTLHKSGTNASAICVYSINTHTHWVKAAERHKQYVWIWPLTAHFGSADILSGRHIVQQTLFHQFSLDILSERYIVSTYCVRHFVSKTFFQYSFRHFFSRWILLRQIVRKTNCQNPFSIYSTINF